MTTQSSSDPWVYVVVDITDGNDRYLGQLDVDTNIAYIPAFREKDDASQSLRHLAIDRGVKIEIQAVFLSILKESAHQQGFLVYLLDADGNITEKIAP